VDYRDRMGEVARSGTVRLLVAEDDPDVHVLLEMVLGSAGYELVMARNGAAALTALREQGPVDLVILDVAMPGDLDGLAVTRRLRDEPAYAGLPVLLLSARTTESDLEQGTAAGATDYLIKPFDTDVLLARISTLLASG